MTTILSEVLFSAELMQEFGNYFKKCVRGYHVINKDPIKESVWEAINSQVLEYSGCTVHSQASGSHRSGSDISCNIGELSNKSVKYAPPTDAAGSGSLHTMFCVSSYRLSSVCSGANPGNIADIITEIKNRKNFQYYSIIARDENEFPGKIHYDWIVLPADHPSVNPESFTWTPLLGKRGKNKDVQIGWITDVVHGSSMCITFSMSSQLWMTVRMTDEMKQKYIIASTKASLQPRLDYVKLSEIYPEVESDSEPVA